MLPLLATVGIGRGRWPAIPFPVPLFLLWPFVGVALVVAMIAGHLRATEDRDGPAGSGPAAAARQVVGMLCAVPGLRVVVDAADGTHVRVAVY
jgi:hypothetical protein